MAERAYVLGVDFGTESVRVGVFDHEGDPVTFAGEAYSLEHPYPGWAEQDPDEWWNCLVKATRRALDKGKVSSEDVVGVSLDATTCTVVAIDQQNRVLRPAIMWMDVRAVDQAKRIRETEDPALKYSGYTNVSAEWMPSKALRLKENEPETTKMLSASVSAWTGSLIVSLAGGLRASTPLASAGTMIVTKEDFRKASTRLPAWRTCSTNYRKRYLKWARLWEDSQKRPLKNSVCQQISQLPRVAEMPSWRW